MSYVCYGFRTLLLLKEFLTITALYYIIFNKSLSAKATELQN